MKLFLDGVLVVEGKEDASYLSNYISSEIVVINGFELDNRIIEYLKNNKVIALLDPDEAGIKIRERINGLIPNITNVEIDISKCTKGEKNGVAECEIDEVLTKLKPFVIEKDKQDFIVKKSDLYELGLLTNKELRDYICEKLKLGKCNGKTLYKRLASANVDIETIKKLIKECHGN